jgi:hypothetical protein
MSASHGSKARRSCSSSNRRMTSLAIVNYSEGTLWHIFISNNGDCITIYRSSIKPVNYSEGTLWHIFISKWRTDTFLEDGTILYCSYNISAWLNAMDMLYECLSTLILALYAPTRSKVNIYTLEWRMEVHSENIDTNLPIGMEDKSSYRNGRC